jgi:hypothetical protein
VGRDPAGATQHLAHLDRVGLRGLAFLTGPRTPSHPSVRSAHHLIKPAATMYCKENVMSAPVYVDKARVVADLRFRQLHARADWVDREFSGVIDTGKNAALLRMLGIDLGAMASGDVVASRS